MLIAFAIQPEKAPKPSSGRKSAATAAHNLNILERRDSFVFVPSAEAVAPNTYSPNGTGSIAVNASLLADMVSTFMYGVKCVMK